MTFSLVQVIKHGNDRPFLTGTFPLIVKYRRLNNCCLIITSDLRKTPSSDTIIELVGNSDIDLSEISQSDINMSSGILCWYLIARYREITLNRVVACRQGEGLGGYGIENGVIKCSFAWLTVFNDAFGTDFPVESESIDESSGDFIFAKF